MTPQHILHAALPRCHSQFPLRERFPIAFSSQALRIFAHVWEGPWRDARAEFRRGVRHVIPSLPSSLTKVRYWFWKPKPCEDYVDQATQMPDLVGASSTTSEFEDMDSVSPGLKVLGSRLEELDIRALITPDLSYSGEICYYRREMSHSLKSAVS
ncbi:hypothetical protein CT0861_04014 [Colletotrichum tofieldiae]|uniref:Uncharacterized protein n=1 Tax=Colletotrichum tofieldiae TaxID=708197 RepID=A0A166Z6X8_9PEZI|nr:hypothetical protein CT0861_04014 [Colletotrichum tofieldiae]